MLSDERGTDRQAGFGQPFALYLRDIDDEWLGVWQE